MERKEDVTITLVFTLATNTLCLTLARPSYLSIQASSVSEVAAFELILPTVFKGNDLRYNGRRPYDL